MTVAMSQSRADDPGTETLGENQPGRLVGIGDSQQRVALGRHRERDAGLVDEGNVAAIEGEARGGGQ